MVHRSCPFPGYSVPRHGRLTPGHLLHQGTVLSPTDDLLQQGKDEQLVQTQQQLPEAPPVQDCRASGLASPSSEVSHHGRRAWPIAHPEKVPLLGFCPRKPCNPSSCPSTAGKCILSAIHSQSSVLLLSSRIFCVFCSGESGGQNVYNTSTHSR